MCKHMIGVAVFIYPNQFFNLPKHSRSRASRTDNGKYFQHCCRISAGESLSTVFLHICRYRFCVTSFCFRFNALSLSLSRRSVLSCWPTRRWLSSADDPHAGGSALLPEVSPRRRCRHSHISYALKIYVNPRYLASKHTLTACCAAPSLLLLANI